MMTLIEIEKCKMMKKKIKNVSYLNFVRVKNKKIIKRKNKTKKNKE